MTLVMDPAGNEIRALTKAATWKGKRVLEIGCGDGRLTLRIAALGPGSIEAVEPQASRLRKARRDLPAKYASRIHYHAGHAGHLRYPAEAFDMAIFSWAL